MVYEWIIFLSSFHFNLYICYKQKQNLTFIMKNKVLILMSGIAVLGITSCTKPTYQQPDAPIQEVPFTQVHINDGFWSPRIETNRTVSIPSAFKESEKNGRFDNFAIAGGLRRENIVVIFLLMILTRIR